MGTPTDTTATTAPAAVDRDSRRVERSSVFHLLPEDGPRADLASRLEIKYVAPHDDVPTLRKLLEGNGRRLVHNEPVSTVRSIYFDDVQLSACHANLSGFGQRQKTRLRWYDSLVPQQEVYLEIKWRKFQITGKHRYALHAERPLAEVTYRQIVEDLIGVVPAEHVVELMGNSEPIVIVEYKREHFAARNSPLRLTLDYDLAFYDQTGRKYISTAFRQPMVDMVLIEAKGPPGCEQDVREFLYPLAPRISPFSKYSHGCHHLGLVHD